MTSFTLDHRLGRERIKRVTEIVILKILYYSIIFYLRNQEIWSNSQYSVRAGASSDSLGLTALQVLTMTAQG